jgi:putative ABC transport system permease protein
MSFVDLAISLVFVFIPLALSVFLKLGLNKDIIIAAVRSVIQLLIVGYLLTFVFENESPVYMILMIIVMIAAASQNVFKKGEGIPDIKKLIIFVLVIVETFSMTLLLSLGILSFTAQEVIPISGMIIGNCMVLSLLFLNKFKDELERSEEVIELILSFGGQPVDAVSRSLKSAIKTSMIPTLEAQKTMGLVQLPGMMSGLIIGGADPMTAVLYQLLILFLIMTNAAVSSVLIGYLSYRKLFNEHLQYVGLTTEE